MRDMPFGFDQHHTRGSFPGVRSHASGSLYRHTSVDRPSQNIAGVGCRMNPPHPAGDKPAEVACGWTGTEVPAKWPAGHKVYSSGLGLLRGGALHDKHCLAINRVHCWRRQRVYPLPVPAGGLRGDSLQPGLQANGSPRSSGDEVRHRHQSPVSTPYTEENQRVIPHSPAPSMMKNACSKCSSPRSQKSDVAVSAPCVVSMNSAILAVRPLKSLW